jgi:energy-coupling factor transport system ATP-binding protein
VPQNAGDLLFLDSVAAELSFAESTGSDVAARAADIFARLIGEFDPARHPRDLSAGQQLALALAVQLAPEPEILLLDEPTRGLDHPARLALAELLLALKAEGTAIALAGHDRDFVDSVADRVVTLDA